MMAGLSELPTSGATLQGGGPAANAAQLYAYRSAALAAWTAIRIGAGTHDTRLRSGTDPTTIYLHPSEGTVRK